jgi:hypothetical protein
MRYFLKNTVTISALLLLGFTTSSFGETFDSPLGDWTSKYETNSGWSEPGPLTIIDKKKATYPFRNGRILFYATDDPYRWEGIWVQDSSMVANCETKKDGSIHWGVYTFQFNEDYTKFDATWDSCGEGKKSREVGER